MEVWRPCGGDFGRPKQLSPAAGHLELRRWISSVLCTPEIRVTVADLLGVKEGLFGKGECRAEYHLVHMLYSGLDSVFFVTGISRRLGYH